MYYPQAPGTVSSTNLAIRVQGDPEALGQRLRAIALDVDPLIRFDDVQTLSRIGGFEARSNWALTGVVAFVGFMVLLLSATGIHSLMAFTVARRTREIGIRAALGAHPRRIVTGIFSRAFLQLGSGVAVGSGIAALWGLNSPRSVAILAGAVAVMMTVGLLACAIPLRRALRIHPTEALRMEG